MSIKDFIQKGWLATYQYYSIPTSSELVKSIESIREFDIEGDYKNSALVEVCDTSRIRAQLYDSYEKNVLGKKGIIYSISREHSEHICLQYRSRGVAIENIDSKTPAKVREKVIQAFPRWESQAVMKVRQDSMTGKNLTIISSERISINSTSISSSSSSSSS